MTKRKRNKKVLVLSPYNPLKSARHFISYYYTEDRFRTLHRHKGGFYTYTGTHYRETADEELNSQLYDFLDKALRPIKDGELVPFEPNKGKVSEVLEALKAKTFLRSDIEVPMWLDDSNPCSADELLVCQNGLLYLPTQSLIEHTPVFFGYAALDCDHHPEAQVPEQWFKFLGQLWPDDPESIKTLQEWFGYCLCPDTRQQKILLIVGPKRSGKGTIGRIQRLLLGVTNVCAPTLSSLTKNFGLQPLIGKHLAIVSDARLGKRADQSTVAERLLSISGEDALTIDRKYRGAWTGTLPSRFMILTNELPRIWDASGALASRFIVLLLTDSFIGREDIGLTDRLATVLPGI